MNIFVEWDKQFYSWHFYSDIICFNAPKAYVKTVESNKKRQSDILWTIQIANTFYKIAIFLHRYVSCYVRIILYFLPERKE